MTDGHIQDYYEDFRIPALAYDEAGGESDQFFVSDKATPDEAVDDEEEPRNGAGEEFAAEAEGNQAADGDAEEDVSCEEIIENLAVSLNQFCPRCANGNRFWISDLHIDASGALIMTGTCQGCGMYLDEFSFRFAELEQIRLALSTAADKLRAGEEVDEVIEQLQSDAAAIGAEKKRER